MAPTLVDLGGELGRQPRLAGAGLADEQGDVAVAGRGWPTTGPCSAGQLARRGRRSRRAPARSGRAGEGARATVRRSAAPRAGVPSARSAVTPTAGDGRAATTGSGRGEVGIVVEDRRLQLGQLGRRVEAELVGEHGPGAGVHAQRVGLAPAAVEGDHQAAGEPLAQRVLVGRALELADRLAVPAEGEEGVEAGLQRLQAQLVPAHGRRPGPLLVGDVGEHRTVPLGQARPRAWTSAALGIVVQRGAGRRRRGPRSGRRRRRSRSTAST